MPQLDFVTYFPQSLWFNIIFWIGFFYFLYTVFPLIGFLFKGRRVFKRILELRVQGLHILLRHSLFQMKCVLYFFVRDYGYRLFNLQREQHYLMIKKNTGLYLIFFNYTLLNRIF